MTNPDGVQVYSYSAAFGIPVRVPKCFPCRGAFFTRSLFFRWVCSGSHTSRGPAFGSGAGASGPFGIGTSRAAALNHSCIPDMSSSGSGLCNVSSRVLVDSLREPPQSERSRTGEVCDARKRRESVCQESGRDVLHNVVSLVFPGDQPESVRSFSWTRPPKLQRTDILKFTRWAGCGMRGCIMIPPLAVFSWARWCAWSRQGQSDGRPPSPLPSRRRFARLGAASGMARAAPRCHVVDKRSQCSAKQDSVRSNSSCTSAPAHLHVCCPSLRPSSSRRVCFCRLLWSL